MLHCGGHDGKSGNVGKWTFAIAACVVRLFVSNGSGIEENDLSRPGAPGRGHGN